MLAAIMLREFALLYKPQVGCTLLAAVRLIAECADICFLLDLPLQLLLKLLLLSRSAHDHAARQKNPPSATHGEGAHD